MPSGKDRLYVALYAIPQPLAAQQANNAPQLTYRWGFCTGPKHEDPGGTIAGTCYRVVRKNGENGHWDWEKLDLASVHSTHLGATRLLARVLIAKVLDSDNLDMIMSTATRGQDTDVAWNHRAWMADVMSKLKASVDPSAFPLANQVIAVTGLATADWPHIRAVARHYVRSKIAHGRYNGPFNPKEPIPTLCMREYRELMP